MKVIVEICLFCGDDSEFQAFQSGVYRVLNKCVKPSAPGMMYNCLLKCQKKAKGRAVSKSRERSKMVSSGTILFFHDVGDNGGKWTKRLGALFPDENIRIFCPTASEMPVGLFNGLCMHSWFDMNKDHDPMEGEIWDIKKIWDNSKSAKFVGQLIDFELLHGTPLDKIILGGHSQGGALALYAGLSYVNKTTEKNLGGIFTLGSWLLLRWEFDSAYAQSIIAVNAPKNVLMCHGERDRKIPVDWGISAKEDLEKVIGNLEFVPYKQHGHEVSTIQLKDCVKFCHTILSD
ncbi:acyl-protein thioesterase 1-like [Tigriopus californicus]|uniref:acyl-protein thioesterase 1-like n=1 Tax=Tigriopus californicus TaxID=6832 RepID=UPI0027DAA41E|nr:acyl-protein thioesterase 1-like [Tigriopus californicus]